MEIKLSKAQRFQGRVRVPSDKSLTHRAVLFSSLAKGVSTIENPLAAADCLSTLSCVEQLGCGVEKKGNIWKVQGPGLWGYKKPSGHLDCGNSGTTMRLLSGILAAQDFTSVMKGDASLSSRPMDRVSVPLTAMGAKFDMKDGKYAPFKITGTKKIKPIQWVNPVASAQVKSAVLLAGLHAAGETSFTEPSLSRDHTERMLESCGVSVKREVTKYSVTGPASLAPHDWVIPGDFSSAAFFIVAALLTGDSDVVLESVNMNPTRVGLLKVLESMGAQFKVTPLTTEGEPMANISVRGRQHLTSGKVDQTTAPHLIDEIPILAVAATQAMGTTIIRGVEELRVKETDRLKAMTQNLTAMGAKIKEEPAGLVIEGPTRLHGAVVGSFEDHRIAMSMAVAALIAEGETVIKGADCVNISFPTFWEILNRLTHQ